jgi:PAS domain S-box-containing protein
MHPATANPSHETPAFTGGGRMGEAIRARDWSSSVLGAPALWPASLRTAVQIMLNCQLPMYIAWGPEFIQFYNDAYLPILGAKEEAAFGNRAQDTWNEIWDTIGPMWEEVCQGRSFGFDDFKLSINRFGYFEDCYFNFSYSPVPDDAGRVGGVLVTFTETTRRVLTERRQAFQLELSQRLRHTPDALAVQAIASELLGTFAGAARVGYGEIDIAAGTVSVARDWARPGFSSLAGEARPLDSFGPDIIAVLRRGEVLRLEDIAADPRSAPYEAGYASIDTASLLIVPLLKAGQLSAILYLHDPAPRHWSDEDAWLAQYVAESTWEAVERARAQEQLAESEDHYRHSVELNANVQWTARPDGQLGHISSRWHEWTGTSGLGDGWSEAVHPDDRTRALRQWSHALATGEPYDVELRCRVRDGSYRWMHSTAHPRRDASGQISAWYGATQDIHAYKTALDAIAKREQEFRALAEAMPNHAWVATPGGELSWFNRRVYEYTGAQEGQLDGAGWGTVVHADDLPHSLESWSAALASGMHYETEFRLRNGAGLFRWFIARALPVRDEAGTILKWIGTNTDVHEHKTAAAELTRLNSNLEVEISRRTADRDRMWRLSTDIMLVAHFDSRIVATNPAWRDVLGWEEAELKGLPFMQLVHPDDVPATTSEAQRLSQGARTLHFENRYRCKNGSYRWLSWTAVPDNRFIHALARDITADKEQAQALHNAERALRQAQKMEAVGQLTGGLAHDFNNLLAGISGNLEMMQVHLKMGRGDNLAAYVGNAMANVDRAAALTHRLLAFSRQQALDPKVVSINELVASMEDLVNRTIGPAIGFETRLAHPLGATRCDPNQLENALLNLVINARDAMPEGGHLLIQTANFDAAHQAPPAGVSVQEGRYVVLSVTDSGSGMTQEVLMRAFDPFFTTKPMGKGTGLGLSMIYGFVAQSGGHIGINSTPGKGTTVTLMLPCCEAEFEHAGPAAPMQAEMRAARGDTVLLVDDEDVLRRILGEMLESLGYRVLAAADSAQALVLLEAAGRVDMLVTDIGLSGGLNGTQLAQTMRQLRPGLKTLFITGYAEDAAVRAGDLPPDTEVLTKPFSLDAFCQRVRQMIDRR